MGDFDFGTPLAAAISRRTPQSASWAVYVLLAVLFGGIGVHNLYARRRWAAAAQFGLFAVGVLLTAALDTIDVAPFGSFSRSPVAGWLTLWMFYDVCCVREDGHGNWMR